MDPHSFSKLDPDPESHSPKKLDPDPHKVNADPKHCLSVSKNLAACLFCEEKQCLLCRQYSENRY
jgi:hypothetical protein